MIVLPLTLLRLIACVHLLLRWARLAWLLVWLRALLLLTFHSRLARLLVWLRGDLPFCGGCSGIGAIAVLSATASAAALPVGVSFLSGLRGVFRLCLLPLLWLNAGYPRSNRCLRRYLRLYKRQWLAGLC